MRAKDACDGHSVLTPTQRACDWLKRRHDYIWQFDWLMWSAQRCSVLEPGELGRTTCVLWGEVHACSQQLLARLSQSFFYLLGFMRMLRLDARTQERASDLSCSTSTNQIARIKHDAASTNHMHTGCRRKYSVFR